MMGGMKQTWGWMLIVVWNVTENNGVIGGVPEVTRRGPNGGVPGGVKKRGLLPPEATRRGPKGAQKGPENGEKKAGRNLAAEKMSHLEKDPRKCAHVHYERATTN